MTANHTFLQLALLLCLLGRPIYCKYIRPTHELYVMSGGNFFVYLDPPKSFGAIANCSFLFFMDDIDMTHLLLNATTPLITEHGEQVLPYSIDKCGVRVSAISESSTGPLILEAFNERSESIEEGIQVNVLQARNTTQEIHVQRAVGQGSIACNTTHNTKHCHIMEPATNSHWPNKCEIRTVIRENRTFECRTYDGGRMEAASQRIVVELLPENATSSAVGTQTESPMHWQLNCQFSEPTYACMAALPNGSQLLIMDGLYNGRFSSGPTDLSSKFCALEIMKPFPTHELGLWRIYNYKSDPPTGCIYYVGQPAEQIISSELIKLNRQTLRTIKAIANAKPIETIEFLFPFPLDECYLRAPNNSIYFPSTTDWRNTASYGSCWFRDLPKLAGIWSCGARSLSYNGGQIVVENIEVVVKSADGEVLTPEVGAKRDQSLQLLCRTAFDEPASHCAFIAPDSTVHLVGSIRGSQTTGRVKYYGRGLLYGDCGLQIDALVASDLGRWQCQFSLQSSVLGTDIKYSIMVYQAKGFGQGASLGLGIGLTLITLLFAGLLIAMYSKRRRLTSTSLSVEHSIERFE